MKVYHSLAAFEREMPTAATIGTFDGVHHGHRRILRQVMEAAKAIGGESVVISFHPHPRMVLAPDGPPIRLLHSLQERIDAFASTGIDKLLLIPFTREFAGWTSERFIQEVLVETVGIKRLVIGYDHHFGKDRKGGLPELEEAGKVYGFGVEEIPAQQIDNANVSSTKIRRALETGDIRTANRFLTYPFPITGEVIHGEKLGRTIGYPTINLGLSDPNKLIPREGVYLCSVEIDGQRHFGMTNIGRKPTVGAHFPVGVEMNIFDFEGDLYGRSLTILFHDWIREDRKFDGLEPLIAAIRNDQLACEALIKNNLSLYTQLTDIQDEIE